MSQRSGAVRGKGFLASASLEARADREGAMAAAGEQVYARPVTDALSNASPSPSIAGPMQASRRDADAKEVKEMQNGEEDYNGMYATPGCNDYDKLNPSDWECFSRNCKLLNPLILEGSPVPGSTFEHLQNKGPLKNKGGKLSSSRLRYRTASSTNCAIPASMFRVRT